jgi:hypothetical protein
MSKARRRHLRERKRKERLGMVSAALLCAGSAVPLLDVIVKFLMIKHGAQ